MHKSANTLLLPRSFSFALYPLIYIHSIAENDENIKNQAPLYFLMAIRVFNPISILILHPETQSMNVLFNLTSEEGGMETSEEAPDQDTICLRVSSDTVVRFMEGWLPRLPPSGPSAFWKLTTENWQLNSLNCLSSRRPEAWRSTPRYRQNCRNHLSSAFIRLRLRLVRILKT